MSFISLNRRALKLVSFLTSTTRVNVKAWRMAVSWIRGGISCAPPGRGSIFLAASAWSSSASSDDLHALRFTSCSGVGSRLDIRISVSLIGSLSRIDPHRVGAEATLLDLKFWIKSRALIKKLKVKSEKLRLLPKDGATEPLRNQTARSPPDRLRRSKERNVVLSIGFLTG